MVGSRNKLESFTLRQEADQAAGPGVMSAKGEELKVLSEGGVQIVAGLDRTRDVKEMQSISRFRQVLPQVLATMACNCVAINVIITLAFSTVAIAHLHHAAKGLSLDDVQVSWIASIPYICQPAGSLLSGLLVEHLGRKRSLVLVNIPFLAGWVTMLTAQGFPQLAAAQVILGVTIGLCEAPLNTYYGEISQPELRGILSGTAGTSYQTGFFLEYLLGTVLDWRTVATINAAFPVFTAIYFCLVPEAPIWLLSKGRVRDAEKALCWLRGWVHASDVREEFAALVRYNENAKFGKVGGDNVPLKNGETNGAVNNGGQNHHISFVTRARDLLKPPTLRPLMLVIPFFFFVHWNGVTSIRPYMIQVFMDFHMPLDPKWTTVLSAGTGILGSICLLFLVHVTGKRRLSLVCTAMGSLAALALGLYAYLVPPQQAIPAATWTPLVLVVILFFSQSMVSQVPWMLLCEVFPYRTRGLSSGITAAACYVFLFLASKTYLDIEHKFLLHGTFWFFGFISIVSFFFLYFFLLETEGKTLEEIELHFTKGQSARKSHITHRDSGA